MDSKNCCVLVATLASFFVSQKTDAALVTLAFTSGPNATFLTGPNILISGPPADTILAGATSATLNYDLSALGIGGLAQSVRVVVQSIVGPGGSGSARTLTAGGGNGISTSGGTNGLWWDSDEAYEISTSLRDAGGADVSAGYTVDLVGAMVRWNAGTGASFNGTTVNPIVAPTLAPAFESFSLPSGETSEFFVTATRSSGPNHATQLSGLQFQVVAVPEPSTLAFGIFAAAAAAARYRRRGNVVAHAD